MTSRIVNCGLEPVDRCPIADHRFARSVGKGREVYPRKATENWNHTGTGARRCPRISIAPIMANCSALKPPGARYAVGARKPFRADLNGARLGRRRDRKCELVALRHGLS